MILWEGMPMESFFRYISYVDFYDKGLRTHNAGFLRWKMQNKEHRIELEIKDAGRSNGTYTIMEENKNTAFGKIGLEEGRGSLKKTCISEDIMGRPWIIEGSEKLDLCSFKGLRIDLGEEKMLRIPLELPIQEKSIMKEHPIKEEKDFFRQERKERPKLLNENIKRQLNPLDETEKRWVEPVEERKREERFEGSSKNTIQIQEIKEKDIEREKEIEIEPPFEDNKWKELCNQYEKVHPFPGGKTFLSIKPQDFIILQENYQRLVHNSFLLHGYYNYQHMILGKLEEGIDKPYYIGVPGVFYEKERQAAGLFGFAGFEGVEIPVRNGSYGYYMIEVKL